MKIAMVLDNLKKSEEILQLTLSQDYLYELRLDKDEKLLKLLEKEILQPEQVILTLRSIDEGGYFKSQRKRKKKLKKMLGFSPQYLDLEFDRDLEFIEEIKASPYSPKLIISKHDYASVMEMSSKMYYVKIANTDLGYNDIIFKFVGKPKTSQDCIRGIWQIKKDFPNSVVLGIGESGMISRSTSKKINNPITFGSIDGKNLPSFLEMRNWTSDDAFYLGLIGRSLSHSLSPEIHSIFLENIYANGRYHVLEVESEDYLEEQISDLQKLGFTGTNITFPYKEVVVQDHFKLSKEVELTNATNTIYFENGSIEAYNTDTTGFLKFVLSEELDEYESAIVVGAGGGGKAVAVSLLNANVEVHMANRTRKRFGDFNPDLRDQVSTYHLYDELPNADIMVNATSLGLMGEDFTRFSRIPKSIKAVVDLVYPKEPSPLNIYCNANQIRYFDGKSMLFHQAADSFEIWTKRNIDRFKAWNEFLDVLK